MVEVIIVYGIYQHPTRKQFTNHKCSSSFWSRHHVLWDSKCESLIVVVIRVFLPPNLELPYWAPACRKAYVPHLDGKKSIFTEMISKDISWSWNKCHKSVKPVLWIGLPIAGWPIHWLDVNHGPPGRNAGIITCNYYSAFAWNVSLFLSHNRRYQQKHWHRLDPR